jgi:hypothetical protein
MALGDTYITLAELKTRLGISDTVDDTLLTGATIAASRGIDGVTHRQFNKSGTATARVFEVDHPHEVVVHDFHTTTGLVVAVDDGSGSYATTWDAADYQVEPLNGLMDSKPWVYEWITAVGSRTFPRLRRAAVRVTADWGWAAVPGDIKEATFVLAEDIAKLRDSPFGTGGYSEYGRIRARKNPHVMMMIDDYIRDKYTAA